MMPEGDLNRSAAALNASLKALTDTRVPYVGATGNVYLGNNALVIGYAFPDYPDVDGLNVLVSINNGTPMPYAGTMRISGPPTARFLWGPIRVQLCERGLRRQR